MAGLFNALIPSVVKPAQQTAAATQSAPAMPAPPPPPPADAIDPATGQPYGMSKGNPNINPYTGASQSSGADTNLAGAPTPSHQLEDLYSNAGAAYLAPGYTSQAMPGLQDQLKQPGQAEQFYQQAQNTATDPYYQRLQQQGMDALNQQMAARGHFNSGGAIAGLGNFQSGLAAQQYHQMGDLANQAQSQGQARVGLSGQLANNADQNDLAHLNSMFNVAGQAQGANQQALNSYLAQQMGIDTSGAGLMGQFYGTGGSLSGQAQSDATNAMVNAAQAKAQGQQARQQLGMQGLQALLGI